jgi:DNA invertase Pin-like site-specific DNA recombinase
MELVSTTEEIDVSGGKALERRDGLREAIEKIEAGEAEVLIVGYFDRLVRSLRVQGEVVSRVEAAGGEVLAVDYGRVTEETASQWLSGTMLGAVHEYQRRSAIERSREIQIKAVERGAPPISAVPTGLERMGDGRLRPTDQAPAVVEAFELRRDGGTIEAVRSLLAERGIDLSYRRVQGLLSNRLLLGEIRFGDLVNAEAHEAVVDRDLFDAVQQVTLARGPKPRSERLLARLGVLRCGTCDGRMVVGTQKQNGRSYPFYRCASFTGCEGRMAISAVFAEEVVVDAVRGYLAEVEGRASADAEARAADIAAEQAQGNLDAAIRAFAGVEGEAAAVERIAELRAIRDEAVERREQLGRLSAALTVSVADWDRFTLEERRGTITDVVERAVVGPGRGRHRITVEFFS